MAKKYYIENIDTGNVLQNDGTSWMPYLPNDTAKPYSTLTACEEDIAQMTSGNYRVFRIYNKS